MAEDLVRFFGGSRPSTGRLFRTIATRRGVVARLLHGDDVAEQLFTLGPALREPVGLIHRAGTETAVIWNRYMDRAIRSGSDAVLAGLRAPAAAAQAGAR